MNERSITKIARLQAGLWCGVLLLSSGSYAQQPEQEKMQEITAEPLKVEASSSFKGALELPLSRDKSPNNSASQNNLSQDVNRPLVIRLTDKTEKLLQQRNKPADSTTKAPVAAKAPVAQRVIDIDVVERRKVNKTNKFVFRQVEK